MNFTVIYFNKRFQVLHEYWMDDKHYNNKIHKIYFLSYCEQILYKDGGNGRKVFAWYGLDEFLSNSLN